MTTFSTRDEAIYRQVIEPLQSDPDVTIDWERDASDQVRAMYDVDAIADAVIGDHSQGYTVTVDDETFWGVVRDNAKEQ